MNVIKVIVDEVPKSCFWCDLCTQSSDVGSMLVTYNCNIVGKSVDAWESDGKRPDWCPLILEEDVETWLMTRPQKPKYVLCDNKD